MMRETSDVSAVIKFCTKLLPAASHILRSCPRTGCARIIVNVHPRKNDACQPCASSSAVASVQSSSVKRRMAAH